MSSSTPSADKDRNSKCYIHMGADIGRALPFNKGVTQLKVYAQTIIQGTPQRQAVVHVHRTKRKDKPGYTYRVFHCADLVPSRSTPINFQDSTHVRIEEGVYQPDPKKDPMPKLTFTVPSWAEHWLYMGRPSHIRRRVGLPAVPKDRWLEGFAGGEDADHEDDVENDEDSGTEAEGDADFQGPVAGHATNSRVNPTGGMDGNRRSNPAMQAAPLPGHPPRGPPLSPAHLQLQRATMQAAGSSGQQQRAVSRHVQTPAIGGYQSYGFDASRMAPRAPHGTGQLLQGPTSLPQLQALQIAELHQWQATQAAAGLSAGASIGNGITGPPLGLGAIHNHMHPAPAVHPQQSPLHPAVFQARMQQAIIAAHMSQQLGAQMAAAGGLGGPAVAALLNLQMQRQKVPGDAPGRLSSRGEGLSNAPPMPQKGNQPMITSLTGGGSNGGQRSGGQGPPAAGPSNDAVVPAGAGSNRQQQRVQPQHGPGVGAAQEPRGSPPANTDPDRSKGLGFSHQHVLTGLQRPLPPQPPALEAPPTQPAASKAAAAAVGASGSATLSLKRSRGAGAVSGGSLLRPGTSHTKAVQQALVGSAAAAPAAAAAAGRNSAGGSAAKSTVSSLSTGTPHGSGGGPTLSSGGARRAPLQGKRRGGEQPGGAGPQGYVQQQQLLPVQAGALGTLEWQRRQVHALAAEAPRMHEVHDDDMLKDLPHMWNHADAGNSADLQGLLDRATQKHGWDAVSLLMESRPEGEQAAGADTEMDEADPELAHASKQQKVSGGWSGAAGNPAAPGPAAGAAPAAQGQAAGAAAATAGGNNAGVPPAGSAPSSNSTGTPGGSAGPIPSTGGANGLAARSSQQPPAGHGWQPEAAAAGAYDVDLQQRQIQALEQILASHSLNWMLPGLRQHAAAGDSHNVQLLLNMARAQDPAVAKVLLVQEQLGQEVAGDEHPEPAPAGQHQQQQQPAAAAAAAAAQGGRVGGAAGCTPSAAAEAKAAADAADAIAALRAAAGLAPVMCQPGQAGPATYGRKAAAREAAAAAAAALAAAPDQGQWLYAAPQPVAAGGQGGWGMYSNAEGRGEELRQQGFAEEGLLSGNQNDIVPLPDEDEEDAPAPALAGQLDAEQQGHNFHHHHHQQQQQQQQEGGLDWGEGLGGEDDLANYEEGLGDYEEVEAVLPRQEDPAVAAAAAQHLGEQQWLRQSAALAGKVSAGVQVAYSVMKPEITQEELARAEVRLFQDIAAAMLEEGLAEAAAAAGYTIEQLDLYVVAQLIKREQEGTAYTTVAQAEYLSRMILLSHRLVYEDPGSRGKLQRVMVAAEAEEAAMRLRAANMPEPPGGWPVYRLQSGSILMLTVAEPNSSRFQLVPLDPPVQLQLQLIEPLGSGGLGSVWGAKPLQQEAWRGPLNLAANDTVPEVVAIKMGVLPCTPHGSAACDGSTTWRLTRENLKAVGFDAFKEAACMKATGPIPFTGDLLVAGVAQVQLGALPSSIVYDMPALVMPCAALGSLHRVVHADQLRVGRLFPDKRMPEPMVRHGVTQVLVALAAGNLVGDIIHRDLKPGNILMRVINGVPVWVLIDYGLAARLNELALGRPKRTYAGTEAYMAPEQRSGEKDQTSKTDMYTVGLIMLELLWGKVVMDQMDRRPEPGPRAQVLHRLLSTDNSIPGISGSLRDFLWFACHPEPDMRFTPDQALQHHYMRGL